MTCTMKVSDMIKQVQDAVKSQMPTKITIENYQKRDGQIYTSESTSIELDNDVRFTYIFIFCDKIYLLYTPYYMCLL